MSSFLHLLALDIRNKYPDFENITIILPNKRASLFLAEELSHFIDAPIWMPKILTIHEFIEKQTGLKKADDLILIIKLYKAYQQVSGSEEKFEDFYFWGNMLLNDFDDIDKYLADAKAVFSNLVSLKELENSFPFLSAEQTEIIKHFWSSFNPDKYSREQQEFLQIWDKLFPTYNSFKTSLFNEKLCYEGMNMRYFYDHLKESSCSDHLIFAGFNALNNCEKQIFTFYRDSGQASFYWDYDLYYTVNEFHEAGKFIREDLKLFPNELGVEHFNNFKYTQKHIEYIAVPSAIGQAKLLPKLIPDNCTDYLETAVVLCDERMLIPAIHSIPPHVNKVNITMGYPAQNTSIAALIFLLSELKKYTKTGKNDCYYYYKPVVALLNHKLIKDLCPEDINQITNYINEKNIIYIGANKLYFNTLTQAIFEPSEKDTPSYVLAILQLLSQILGEEKKQLHPIEKEFIFTLYTQLQRLQNTFKEEGIEPDEKLYMQVINKVVNTTTIPFSGEPLEGLQLMGLLETRILDFRNLILLSANEGILPRTNIASSFIPYNLRAGFKLPTPEYQDALYAYNFYRLLQRAENIKILYSTTVQGINSGEMSRYLFQLKYESGISVKEYSFQNHISISDFGTMKIQKSEEICKSLLNIGNSADQALSPSALNTYMDCPLKFYFKYIENIKEKDEMTEELDHRLLGNIFHESSESLYATVADQEITKNVIDQLLHNQELIDKHIQTSYFHFYDHHINQLINSGSNELILEIIRKYIRQMLRYDRQVCPFRIISMEKKYHFSLDVDIEGQKRKIYIGGIIDRIDQTASAIRIIDYKTGADTTAFKSVASVFDPANPTRNKAAFQTMLYCLMFGEQYNGPLPLCPGIYSTKLLFNPDYNHLLKCDKDYILNFEHHRQEFTEYLSELLKHLLSSNHSFNQTQNEKKCRNCKYAILCRKD